MGGAEPVYLGIARDNVDDVKSRLAAGAGLDLVVTIGGASVGDHDHLRQVFARDGGELYFEKIAVKPGKPPGSDASVACPIWDCPEIRFRPW